MVVCMAPIALELVGPTIGVSGRSLDSALIDRHVDWKDPGSKVRSFEAVPENLVETTRAMNIKLFFGSGLLGP